MSTTINLPQKYAEWPVEYRKLPLFLQHVLDTKINHEFDRIIPVVGDEGFGKSTLMLQGTRIWKDLRGLDPTVEDVLDQLVWDQPGFKRAMANYPRKSVIPVQDAARVLYKKEAMQSDQKEIEKDLLDTRTKEFLMLLGFQDWGIIPTMLQERRAKNVLRIKERGLVYAYNRESLDEKVETGDWPEPDMEMRFVSLDGTDLWSEFKQQDREQKESRIDINGVEDEEESWEPKEVVEDVLAGNVADYIDEHNINGSIFVDADLLQYDYGLTVRGAKQVKKVIKREVDIEAVYRDDAAGQKETHTA